MAIVTQSAQSQSNSAVNGQSVTYILGLVLQQCGGAPDSLVGNQIQQVLRDFYTKTNAWRVTLGPFFISQGVDTVQLNPVDAYSSVVHVFAAYLYPYPANTTQKVNLPVAPYSLVGGEPSRPNRYWMLTPDTLTLYPKPDVAYGNILYVQASVKPVINTTQLPPITTEHHLDAIVAGALSRLYLMPNKPWTQREEGMRLGKVYAREILVWRDHANRQYGSADTPFRYPSFAGAGSQRLGRGR